jgi:peptidoglycan/xylan/chitin deacetylase (PgdA/CDA1 family)
VLLAFDDAWSTLWTVAAPLLRKYGMRAVTYAIPSRIRDAAAVRGTIDDGITDPDAADRGPDPLVTWPELRALAASGVIDVQSHTWSHTMMFSGRELVDFVSPDFRREPALNRPRVNEADPPRFLDPSELGAPLYSRRSRMSDGLRFLPDPAAHQRCVAHVAAHGRERFFEAPGWQKVLRGVAGNVESPFESGEARQRAIEKELAASREELEGRLGTRVRHICLPWGVAGTITRELLPRTGFLTAFANRIAGRFAVASGDDPFALKRLSNRYIFSLPGRGRRYAFRR